MHAYQWFFMGMMAAYTACLILLAFLLRGIEANEAARARVSSSRTNGRLYRSRQSENFR